MASGRGLSASCSNPFALKTVSGVIQERSSRPSKSFINLSKESIGVSRNRVAVAQTDAHCNYLPNAAQVGVIIVFEAIFLKCCRSDRHHRRRTITILSSVGRNAYLRLDRCAELDRRKCPPGT